MNLATAKAALTLMEEGQAFALVTIVEAQGSSPRHVGTSMLVTAGGSIVGTVGGGPLEAAAIRNASHVLETKQPALMGYDLTAGDAAGLGMICGGRGQVLVESIAPSDAAAKEIFRAVVDLLGSGREGWLITDAAHDAGRARRPKCLFGEDGSITGDLRWPLEAIQEYVKKGLSDRGTSDVPTRAYVQVVGGQGTAYVFGAGHCGQQLVPVLKMLGFVTIVIDDRAEFASAERFPTADRIIVPESFEAGLRGVPVGTGSYIVIMTRGHVHDKNVLREALRTRAGYIGMIGSKKKVAETFRGLQEEGVPAGDLARVHAPIGLPIAAETPEEIAISIAAELVQVRANRRK